MPIKLTPTDLRQLQGVHPDLIKVVKRAAEITTIPFRVLEGLRSLQQQKENIKKGVSWTLKSRHLTGHAVDVAPIEAGGKTSWAWPLYYKLAAIMKQAAKDVGVTVEWGGDWRKKKDGPHWQLPWATYPANQTSLSLLQPGSTFMEREDYHLSDPVDPETEAGAATKSVAYAGGGTGIAATLGGGPLATLIDGALQQQYELSSGDTVRIVVAVVILAGCFYLAYKKAKVPTP